MRIIKFYKILQIKHCFSLRLLPQTKTFGCHGKRRGLRGEAAGHAAKRRTCELAAKPRAAKPRRGGRGKAAYNLVKYYLAFAFKLFYYVFFDL